MDRDILKSDDLIGGSTLDLKPMAQDLILKRTKMILHKDYFESYLRGQYEKKGDDMAN